MESGSASGRRRVALLRIFGTADAVEVESVLRERRAAVLAALLRRALSGLFLKRRAAGPVRRAAPRLGGDA